VTAVSTPAKPRRSSAASRRGRADVLPAQRVTTRAPVNPKAFWALETRGSRTPRTDRDQLLTEPSSNPHSLSLDSPCEGRGPWPLRPPSALGIPTSTTRDASTRPGVDQSRTQPTSSVVATASDSASNRTVVQPVDVNSYSGYLDCQVQPCALSDSRRVCLRCGTECHSDAGRSECCSFITQLMNRRETRKHRMRLWANVLALMAANESHDKRRRIVTAQWQKQGGSR